MTTYKTIEVKDIEIIIPMMLNFYAIDNYPLDIETTKKLFQEFISNENLGKCWLIYDQDEIVGYVILTFVISFEYQGRIAFLDELYIKENSRGKGFGSQTIAFIKSEIPNLSLKLLYLEVEKHNKNAQKLYIAHDFEFHKRELMKFKV